MKDAPYYIFGSRVLTHVLFWLLYFLAFGLIWKKGDNIYDSYYLEFVLLPMRIGTVYVVIYYLLPEILLQKKYIKFLALYGLLLLVAGLLQRLFLFFFYESNRGGELLEIVTLSAVFRSMILINSTVLVVSAIKILMLYHGLKDGDEGEIEELIQIKSDKRFFRIQPSEIMIIEGLGNYIVYYLSNGKKLIRYASMKEALTELPDRFIRIHKSYIVNKIEIKSYNHENVEIQDRFLPIGKSFDVESLRA